MKNLSVLIIIWLSINCTNAQTSSYHPFPDSDAVWTQSWGHGLILCSEEWSYKINGDTTIGTSVYHKIYIPYVQVTGNCGAIHTAGYNGCYRQDQPAKKVYYIAPGSSVEVLLYDFNLQVGDTIYGSTRFGCTANIDTISGIDSILIGSTYRKRWTIGTSFSANHIIEGIGYESGLLETCGGSMPDISYFSLDCFQQEGENLYPDTMTVCNLIETTGSSFARINAAFYPMPIKYYAAIKVSDEFLNSELTVFDLTGKKLRSQLLTNYISVFNREQLIDGIYFYVLKNKNGETINGKIILQ